MRSRLIKATLLGLLVGTVGLIISVLPIGLRLDENVGMDVLFNLRGERKAPPEVVIISIDKESCEHLNLPDNPDKWPRSIHARLIENLTMVGAEVIAFDVHFIEPRSVEDDQLFAKAIGDARNVVLCEPLKAKEIPAAGKGATSPDVHSIVKIIKPLELFAKPASATAPFVLPRIPFKVSQYWTFQAGAGDSPTLPAVVFQLFTLQAYGDFVRVLEKASPQKAGLLPRYWGSALETKTLKELMRRIRGIFESEPMIARRMLNELKSLRDLSLDGKKHQMVKSLIGLYQNPSSRYINYYGPPRTITTIPYHQALRLNNGPGEGHTANLKGKAVFVGLSEVLLAERKDSFYTVFSQANGIFISGVEIAATAFANLAEGRSLKPLPLHFFVLTILFWGILLGALCRITPLIVSALCAAGLSLLYLFFAAYQFKTNDIWYPTVVPILLQTPLAFLGAVVWNYVDVNKERQNIKKALGFHLPKEVVDQIAKDIVHIETGAQVVYGICLFTDVEQYTTLSETLDPVELGRLMNRYYETIFKPVKEYNGYVSGVIGDTMLAVWATTEYGSFLKEKACSAALEIKKQLMQFGQSSDAPNLRTRIGLHCGQILLGHIGALDHYEYTPMGDIVNTASRIENLNKQLGTGLLISDEVVYQLHGFLTRELGKFRVVGKVKPIVVHELLGRLDESGKDQSRACAAFTEALDYFKKQSWDEALTRFHDNIKAYGEDGPSRFYTNMCETYKKNPPEEPWDQVIRLDRK
jgi:adenylate cyclase